MARRNYRNAALTVVALLAYTAYAQVAREKVVTAVPVDRLSTQEIEEQLQVSLALAVTLSFSTY